jgi:membrane carboxypeptidase/penicillin-binding protein
MVAKPQIFCAAIDTKALCETIVSEAAIVKLCGQRVKYSPKAVPPAAALRQSAF